MVDGCGHDVAPGARFCGTCGAERAPDGPPPGGGADAANPSTPWPTAPRRPVSVDKTPTIAIGATTPFAPTPPPSAVAPPPPVPAMAPPPAGATPPPPGFPAGPGPMPPPHGPPAHASGLDRRMPLILGFLVLVLVAAVLALSFKILGSSDDDEADNIATASSTAPSKEIEQAATTSTPTTASSAPATAPPTTAPATSAPTTAPPATAPPRTTAPPVALADELVATLDGYVGALDAGDIDGAYAYIAPELRAQDGWDVTTFTEFWTNDVVGASVVDVGDVSTASGRVDATIDYLLPGGATSREDVALVFAPVGDAGLLALVDYEVVDTERID